MGAVHFSSPPDRLTAIKAVDGLVLVLPTRIELRALREDSHRPMVSGLSAEIQFAARHVGTAIDKNSYVARVDTTGDLRLHLTSQALGFIERTRNAGPVEFRYDVRAELAIVLRQPGTRALRTEPERRTANITVTYSKEAWLAMLHATGFGENVLVEVPLPPAPAAPWDVVWSHLRDARATLEQGGSTGWSATVVECRKALEKWQEIEREDHAPRSVTDAFYTDRTMRRLRGAIDRLVLPLTLQAILAKSGAPKGAGQ